MLKKEYKGRIIFHIDMNAFFCSVACIKNPTLRGKAFAIGRENTTKGVLSTASYEARKYGIHSAMPVIEAYRLYPKLIVVEPNYEEYMKYHNLFVNMILEYTKLVEVASIDEVYADMTEISNEIHPIVLAKTIQLRLLKELKLSASIGIAPTLFLAKMASDIKKPLGLTVIRKREIEKILYPLSVKDIYGIGKKSYPKLIDNNILTIKDFMDLNNKDKIISLIGENQYNSSYEALQGKSSNVVNPKRYETRSSISTMTTFDVNKTTVGELMYEARGLIRDVINSLNYEDLLTKTVIITLRNDKFETLSRRITIDDYTNDKYVITDIVNELIETYFKEGESYRLLGVGLSNLIKSDEVKKEYNLFTLDDKDLKELSINKLINEVQEKYGKKALYFKKNEEK